MRFIRKAALSVAAMGALVLVPGAALASNGPAEVHQGATPGQFSYDDPLLGPLSCNEVHHATNTLPANSPAGSTTLGGYDTIICILATPAPFGAGETFTTDWVSDFGTQFDQNAGFIVTTFSGGGRTSHGVAWYPNG